jgi:hypothetical protein
MPPSIKSTQSMAYVYRFEAVGKPSIRSRIAKNLINTRLSGARGAPSVNP